MPPLLTPSPKPGGARIAAGPAARPGNPSWWRPFDQACLNHAAHYLAGVPIRIVLGDTLAADAAPEPHVATVRFHDRAALLKLILNPDLGFGEGYMSGCIDVEGDLVGMLEEVTRRLWLKPWARGPLHALRRWLSSNPLGRSWRNVHAHYDLGNDFYRLWLDREMVYTCAYYPRPGMSLEEAQAAKNEHVARKLNLRPGETVFEAGCGWGSLAIHLARYHRVRVRAWNISGEQVRWARAWAEREGLSGQVEFVEQDYRQIEGTCDAFVSIGMLEHVGHRQHTELGRVIDRCLHPGHGRGLLHFIGRNAPAPTSPWIARYIFPGAYIPSLEEAIRGVLQPAGFSILDVENLRLHYAATLAEWLERFEQAAGTVQRQFGEPFVRQWRLYLAEAQAGFRAGGLQLFQVTFGRPADNAIPMNRAGLYRE